MEDVVDEQQSSKIYAVGGVHVEVRPPRDHQVAYREVHHPSLSLESGETLRTTGNPNSKKETPRPNSKASPAARNMSWGSWAAVGSTPTSAGVKRMGPKKNAGAATSVVTKAALTQGFMVTRLLSHLLGAFSTIGTTMHRTQ